MHLDGPVLFDVEQQEPRTHKFQKFQFPRFGNFRPRKFRSVETEQDKNLFPALSNDIRQFSLMLLQRVLVIKFRQQRLPVKGGRIVKPPRAPERYICVDVDLRSWVGSTGAQSHLNKPKDIPASLSFAAAASVCNRQGEYLVSLPDIDEVA